MGGFGALEADRKLGGHAACHEVMWAKSLGSSSSQSLVRAADPNRSPGRHGEHTETGEGDIANNHGTSKSYLRHSSKEIDLTNNI
uniref:Uncharacterized protein n=1 Tax=Timema genevievae TaxID=629358 RepID=A0A7R9PMF1_TIMGE|nr:unnamed protein product [Timema genevievae]